MAGRSIWRMLSEPYTVAKGLFRYKETLFWVILFPIVFYGISVAFWGSPEPPTITVGLYNGDDCSGCIGVYLEEALNESGLFRVVKYSDEASLRADVSDGKVPAGIVVPDNATKVFELGERYPVRVYTVRSQWGGFAEGTVLGFLSGFEDTFYQRIAGYAVSWVQENATGEWAEEAVKWINLMVDPVNVTVEEYVPPLMATKEGLRAFYAISMGGVEALFIGLYVGAMAVNEKKRTGTLKVILSSPTTSAEMMAAETLSALLLVAVSTLAIIGISLATGARYLISPGSAALVAALLAIGTVFSVGVGLLISAVARTPEGAGALVNMIAWPVMFAGGIVIPPDIIPENIRFFAEAWPLSRALEAVRKVLIYGATPGEALEHALPAIAVTVVVYIVGFQVYARLLEKAQEY